MKLEKEVWNDIKGYKGYYKISNFGNIKSLDRELDNKRGKFIKKGKLMRPILSLGGYLKINLYIRGKMKTKLIHRLVAINFIRNKSNKKEVNHKDGNKRNNHIDNLEWVTAKENTTHAVKIGLFNNTKAVKMFSKSGVLLGVYDSLIEAEKITGVRRNGISEVLNGRQKTSGGYLWKYKELIKC
jgi:hypothetical protein